MDIKRPVRKKTSPPIQQPVTPLAVEDTDSKPLKRSFAKRIVLIVSGLILALTIAVGGWYAWALAPLDSANTQTIRLVVEPGETSSTIANKLAETKIIKSSLAFQIHAELTGQKHKLQAGGYALSPSQSVQTVTNHLVSGKFDELNIIILPGLTLKQQQDPNFENSLAYQGFEPKELAVAFSKTYDHPLLAKKPAGTSLEGYIYPETYRVNAASSAEELLELTFNEFYQQIETRGIEDKLAQKGLSLHQGLTLASIIQKEVSYPDDQKQVAQVFLKRLSIDMPLGSDVTFLYAATLLGVEPSVNLESPYNTRIKTGLPPGPIANFNLSALTAVIEPAKGDYLYFLADENGVTHYAETLEGHEANVTKYCTAHCNDF